MKFHVTPTHYNLEWLPTHKNGGAYAPVDYQLSESGTIALWYKTDHTFMYNDPQIWDNSGTDPTHPEDNWEMWIDAESTICWRASDYAANDGVYNDPTWSGVACRYCLADESGGTPWDYLDTWLHLAVTWERVSYEPVYYDNPLTPEYDQILYCEDGFMIMKMSINGDLVDETPSGTDPSLEDVAHVWQDPGNTFDLGSGNSGDGRQGESPPGAMILADYFAPKIRLLTEKRTSPPDFRRRHPLSCNPAPKKWVIDNRTKNHYSVINLTPRYHGKDCTPVEGIPGDCSRDTDARLGRNVMAAGSLLST